MTDSRARGHRTSCSRRSGPSVEKRPKMYQDLTQSMVPCSPSLGASFAASFAWNLVFFLCRTASWLLNPLVSLSTSSFFPRTRMKITPERPTAYPEE